MKKEDLLKLGLDEQTAQKAADASNEELKGYIPKVRFDEVNNEKKKLELDVRDRDSQLEGLKNSNGDVEAMKTQISTLQADNKAKDEAHAAEIKQLKIDSEINTALSASKAKNAKAVKALLELDPEKIEFNDDGSIKGLSDQIKKLQEGDDSKFLFNIESKPNNQFKGFAPGEKSDKLPGDGKPTSLADAVKIHFTNNE